MLPNWAKFQFKEVSDSGSLRESRSGRQLPLNRREFFLRQLPAQTGHLLLSRSAHHRRHIWRLMP